MRGKTIASCIALVLLRSNPVAQAQELENLLPDGIPGYGKPFGVSQLHELNATSLQFGSFTAAPVVSLSQGYDSAPDGATGSAVFNGASSLLLANPILGLGAYAAATAANYEQNASQNTAGLTLAAGERAVTATQTFTVSAGYLRDEETGFALDTITITRPIAFDVEDYRAKDEIALGLFTLTPAVSLTRFTFPSLPSQNRTDTREALNLAYVPGGPMQLIIRLQTTQSNYREAIFSADTSQLLAGAQDTADGLWTFSALAGAARRNPRFGPDITAPVLEAGLDWMPSDFDKLRLELAREIDDPDEVSAAAYTLSQAKFSLDHQLAGGGAFKLTAQAANAGFFHSRLRETLTGCTATLTWPLGPYLALNAAYAFNDRQANELRAANEHIFTLGTSWTP